MLHLGLGGITARSVDVERHLPDEHREFRMVPVGHIILVELRGRGADKLHGPLAVRNPLWEGVDGARIMVALEPGRYSWNEFPEGDLSANEELAESARKSPFGIAYRYYGNKLANGSGDRCATTISASRNRSGRSGVPASA